MPIQVDGRRPCPPCTYSRADWAAHTGTLANRSSTRTGSTVFPAGMDIGIFNPGQRQRLPERTPLDRRTSPDGRRSRRFLQSTVVGLPSPLPGDVVNPTTARRGNARETDGGPAAEHRVQRGRASRRPMPGFGNMIYINPALPTLAQRPHREPDPRRLQQSLAGRRSAPARIHLHHPRPTCSRICTPRSRTASLRRGPASHLVFP